LDIDKHSTLRYTWFLTLAFSYTISHFGFPVTCKLSMFVAKYGGRVKVSQTDGAAGFPVTTAV
jgi:hypothetical protein